MKRCSFFYLMVVYGLVFSSYSWSAKEENLLLPVPKKYTFEKVLRSNSMGINQKLSIHIRRFKKEGAPPLILSHALILNSIAMEALGRELWQKGYDVWMPNMRGHGNGSERSTIYPYLPGDYGFDQMISHDLPLILDKIFSITKKKVHLMGLSMGALLWDKYLDGIGLDEMGNFTKERNRAMIRRQKVLSYTALGIPLDIWKINPQIKKLLLPFIPMVKPFHFFIPLTTNQDPAFKRPLTLKEIFRRQLIKAIKPIFVEILPLGIITRDGIDTKNGEREDLVTTYISQAHTDIVHDFLRWLHRPYNSRSGEVSYKGPRYSKTPSLFIFGEKDQLAPYDLGEEQIPHIYDHDVPPIIYKFCKKAHVDLILNKAVKPVGKILKKFLKDPKKFLKSRQFINEMGHCD